MIDQLRSRIAILLRDRRGATAAIVAIALPTLVLSAGLAVATASVQVNQTEMLNLADAAAGAARTVYDSYTSGHQQAATTEALRIAAANNLSNAVSANDVVEGWWDVTSSAPDKFGACVAGQTGLPFCNAVRVNAHINYQIPFGALLGRPQITLSAWRPGTNARTPTIR